MGMMLVNLKVVMCNDINYVGGFMGLFVQLLVDVMFDEGLLFGDFDIVKVFGWCVVEVMVCWVVGGC